MAHPKIFIDGEAGTTGLQVRSRLSARNDIVLSLLHDKRRDIDARRKMLNEADLVILCLPDAQAIEAVGMIENPHTKIIDASTAHRTHPDWVYGFVEYDPNHAAAIVKAKRVSNPGCYALTSVALLHPLISKGLLPADFPVSLAAVSGYSGGGKQMIEAFEQGDESYHLYGLSLNHKHLPEITKWAGLTRPPIFVPSVAPFIQGMAVQLPVPLSALKITFDQLYDCYQQHYANADQVKIEAPSTSASITRLKPQAMANQDGLTIHLFQSPDRENALAVGVLDNLGKGASGQAVQNMELMLGLGMELKPANASAIKPQGNQ